MGSNPVEENAERAGNLGNFGLWDVTSHRCTNRLWEAGWPSSHGECCESRVFFLKELGAWDPADLWMGNVFGQCPKR